MKAKAYSPLRFFIWRSFYSCLFYLLIPFILLRLYWRGIKAPAYRQRWRERFGYYCQPFPAGVIWFHAVSVGEAEALFPLARLLQSHYPSIPLLITTTTPTGSARVKAVMQDSVCHVYLPYDVPGAVKRFMRCFKPRLAVIMETEIWPNLYAYCGNNGIPLFIINARLSEKSSHRYQKIPTLVGNTLANLQGIAAQTEADAKRFVAIGADPDKVKPLGNIKFAVEIPAATIGQGLQLKADNFAGRFVWLVASTHKGEEAIFLEIFQQVKARIPELLLVIVPRHPERFDEVYKLCGQLQLTVVKRSANGQVQLETAVYLADTMGELKMLYAASDVAFVGGSMVPRGGHNILEASAVGVAVMFGPFMDNFKEIARGVLSHDAAIQCQDKDEIIAALLALYAQPDFRMALAVKGKTFVENNQGALSRIFALLEPAIIKSI
ncbi:MAG: lipid IV(A) 3-deoxy-D-manno-octulosonic acid transferase [Methylococcales bacterium]|nr:lipid IV(A) 3-deoxy-D-manno-octulosonic acid transferase [Methylococcales bacterium]